MNPVVYVGIGIIGITLVSEAYTTSFEEVRTVLPIVDQRSFCFIDVTTDRGEYQVWGDCKVIRRQHEDLAESSRVIIRHDLLPVQTASGRTVLDIGSFFPI